MTFAAPWMLWSLAAILPLVAIYMLKVRPRRRPVTALFLWQQVLQERRAHRLFHRLRDLWSLLLMALAFTAVALALAQPRWSGEKHQDLLLLIDTSASMQAREGNTTRLALAQERVRDIARAMDGVQRVAVATVDRELRYLAHLTDNPREVLAAVERAQASNYELNPRALPRSRISPKLESEDADKAVFDESARHRTLLISDAGFDRTTLPEGVEVLTVGGPQENIGIIAADLAYMPGEQSQLQFYFQIASSYKEPCEIDLILSEGFGERAVMKKVFPLTVQPGLNDPQVLTIDAAAPGRWTAKLDVEDALAADNTAYLVAHKPLPIAIEVRASNRFFLEKSVLAFATGSDLLTLVTENPQVVLAQGAPPDAERAIILSPMGESLWWDSLGEEVEIDAARVVVENHPALRHIDAGTIGFLGARQVTPPNGSHVLVESIDGVPLIYVAKREGKSAIVINLDPIAADFYFSAWFPVLIHSASTFLVDREEPLQSVEKPGSTVSLPIAEDTIGEATSPTGKAEAFEGKQFTELSELGFYELAAGQFNGPIACSLLSKSETFLGNDKETSPITAVTSGLPPAYWLTVFAILLLTTESLLYQRRKVG